MTPDICNISLKVELFSALVEVATLAPEPGGSFIPRLLMEEFKLISCLRLTRLLSDGRSSVSPAISEDIELFLAVSLRVCFLSLRQ